MNKEQKETAQSYTVDNLELFKDEESILRNSIAAKKVELFRAQRDLEEGIPAKDTQVLLNEYDKLIKEAEEKLAKAEGDIKTLEADVDLAKLKLDLEEVNKAKELGVPSLQKAAKIANLKKSLKTEESNKQYYANLISSARKALGIKA